MSRRDFDAPLEYVGPSVCPLLKCCILTVSTQRLLPKPSKRANAMAGWLPCCWLCVPANVLALKRWRLETSQLVINYYIGGSPNSLKNLLCVSLALGSIQFRNADP
jgi:hypothetical protein